MKLDRNITTPRRGKYALIKLRECAPTFQSGHTIVDSNAVDYGETPETYFFVIRLKDKYAAPALQAYALAASQDDNEYAAEIFALAKLAETNPFKKNPD